MTVEAYLLVPMKVGTIFTFQEKIVRCDACQSIPYSQSNTKWPEWHIRATVIAENPEK